MATEADSGADRGERGVQYPNESLEVATQLLSQIKVAVGFTPASRETMVEALGYKSINGASARRVALLSHYGLMDRAGVGSSRISELGRRILLPTSDIDRQLAIAEAALRPTLFGQVFEKLKGHSVPSLLPNLMTREFGVYHGSAEPAAKAFRDTMEYAGLLRNGVLLEEVDIKKADRLNDERGDAKSDADDNRLDRGPAEDGPPSVGLQRYTIALDSSGRVARIDIPTPVSTKDLRKVQRWAEYMEGVLEDEEG